MDREQIKPGSRVMLDKSDMGYTCMSCEHELQSEHINTSLIMENRNAQEADPEVLSNETHKEVGCEQGTVTHTSSNPNMVL